jgi:N-acetylmuramoyl-L-alanine amidase
MSAQLERRGKCGRDISAILFAVRTRPIVAIFLLCALGSMTLTRAQQEQTSPQPAASQEQSQQPAPQQPLAPQIVPPSAVRSGPIVILDPAHGGADTGARGSGAIMEKDIVLLYARVVRVELERQGFRVLMTRNDDSNPSYDDRAAVANGHRDALFISFHISSTGTPGIARAYYYQFSGAAQLPAGSVTPWEEAQLPFVETSRRYADVLAADLAQHFSGSPAASLPVAVRELRSVAAPAVAVEISSVSVSDPNTLNALAQPLATSVVRSILAFRPAAPAGGK